MTAPSASSLHCLGPPLFTKNSPSKKSTSTTTISTIVAIENSSINENSTQPHPCLVSLEKCSNMSELKVIHAQMLRTGLFFDEYNASKVIAFCALQDSGSLRYARLAFTQIPNPPTCRCNSIIRGYTNKNSPRQALLFYQEMLTRGLAPDRFTFPSLFKSGQDLCEGEQFYCHSTKLGFASDSYIQNTLTYTYSQCRCLVSARKVFEKMVEKSVVSWATMLKPYALCDQPDEAVKIF